MAKFIDLAKHSIDKLGKEVDTCSYYAPMSIVVSMKFLEDSFHEPEISYEEYESYKNKIDNLATKFSQDCICINKDRMGIELKKVLSKYGYIIK